MSDHDAIRGALALLVPPSADDAEWQDVLARADRHVETRRRRLYALVATGGLAIAVALALAVAPPWHGGPSLLDRAAAILSPTGASPLPGRDASREAASRGHSGRTDAASASPTGREGLDRGQAGRQDPPDGFWGKSRGAADSPPLADHIPPGVRMMRQSM